jgi:hypothetical protein
VQDRINTVEIRCSYASSRNSVHAMTRPQIALLTIGLAIICLTCIFIGKALGNTKTIIVNQIPESFVCQPFRTPADQAAQQKELNDMGAKPVMDQMLFRAFQAQSKGEGELLRISDRVCKDNPGSIESRRATTYYFVSKVATR